MSKYLDFINEVLEENPEAKKEVDLLSIKYEIIRLLIGYRKKNNITQSEFAEKIGIKQQMISRFEKGNVDPRLSFITKVVHGMNYNVEFTNKDYLMTSNSLLFSKKRKTRIPNKYSLITDYKKAN